jgi:tetratricopeptide (TPR) repeat protein
MMQITLREYLRTTEDAISSGRLDEAMANCQNILTYFPDALEAQRLLGEVYLAQNHLEEAQQTFEWILTNDPENVIVYCSRALISTRTDDVDTALDCYQQAYELSRGNTKIREAFNQLSTSVGQQEFMCSRAGLARLYMRGNLLTQAIQEWEAVLATSPERLDARLGLMETYWREGQYDKAEQTAIQLLDEIPTCLKALLYLAHIASISNIQRAKELLRRAEALDPEFHRAQEVFADLAASTPNDPFLELIEKKPVMLENGAPTTLRGVSSPVAAIQSSAPMAQPVPEASASMYGTWDMLNNWEKAVPVNTAINQSIAETPTRINWENNGHGAFHAANDSEEDTPTWPGQLGQSHPAAEKEQPWYQDDPYEQSNADPRQEVSSWSNRAEANANQTEDEWNSELQDDEQPTPPAWLDTLTRNEQDSSTKITALPQAEITPVVPEVRAPLLVPQESKEPEEEVMPFLFPSDEGEEETNWPDWLKSLGAATLEPEQSASGELPDPFEGDHTSSAMPTRSWEVPQTSAQNQPSEPALPTMNVPNNILAEANQPEWMQQISPREMSPAPSAQAPVPDWMQQLSPAKNAPAQAPVPDWMQQLSPAESAPTAFSKAASPAQPTQAPVPDWMQQLSPAESAPAASSKAASPAQPNQAPVPDWMQQLSPAESPPAASSKASSPAQPAQTSVPDWMQQLSPAESPPAASSKAASSAQPSQASLPDWMQQFTSSQTQDTYQSATPDWMQQLASTDNISQEEPATPQIAAQAAQEERYLASLAHLEKSLQAQGFVPLVPGALASIAQTQTNEQPTPTQTQPAEETSLSSALAQLGNLSQPTATSPTSESSPWWDSTLSQTSEQSAPAVPLLSNEQVNPFAALGVRADEGGVRQISPTPLPATPQPPAQVFAPTTSQNTLREIPLTPTYRSDALLDSDLEMTMKRPAIKLQPMQTDKQSERPHTNGRNQGEHKLLEHGSHANLNNHERLVRGYQHQLSGAYDEAMQEYRLIIRNAPELLDDVISNIRALLKFNPRFSLGYRVLGDAYMRRGEYLQAMESYNKALTMAKKGKN